MKVEINVVCSDLTQEEKERLTRFQIAYQTGGYRLLLKPVLHSDAERMCIDAFKNTLMHFKDTLIEWNDEQPGVVRATLNVIPNPGSKPEDFIIVPPYQQEHSD